MKFLHYLFLLFHSIYCSHNKSPAPYTFISFQVEDFPFFLLPSLPPPFSLSFPPSFPSLLASFLPFLTFSFIRYYFQHLSRRLVTNKYNMT